MASKRVEQMLSWSRAKLSLALEAAATAEWLRFEVRDKLRPASVTCWQPPREPSKQWSAAKFECVVELLGQTVWRYANSQTARCLQKVN